MKNIFKGRDFISHSYPKLGENKKVVYFCFTPHEKRKEKKNRKKQRWNKEYKMHQRFF